MPGITLHRLIESFIIDLKGRRRRPRRSALTIAPQRGWLDGASTAGERARESGKRTALLDRILGALASRRLGCQLQHVRLHRTPGALLVNLRGILDLLTVASLSLPRR